MDTAKGVLVFGEIIDGKLAPVTIELLGVGRKLAGDLGEELSVLLLGSKAGSLGQEAIAYGADIVYINAEGIFDAYNSDAYTQAAADLCRKALPAVMLFGHTDIGGDLAPRLNGRLRRQCPRNNGSEGCPPANGHCQTEDFACGRA